MVLNLRLSYDTVCALENYNNYFTYLHTVDCHKDIKIDYSTYGVWLFKVNINLFDVIQFHLQLRSEIATLSADIRALIFR